MYTEKQKQEFINVAESLKKYRRADLNDENGKNILEELYVDLLPSNVILNKCMLDNTTFLIGRKGTGKSTIFLKLEQEYRKKKKYIPCYIDVKTIYESSQAQAINNQYLSQFFDEKSMEKYLISRNFLQSLLKQIYNEVDKQRKSVFQKFSSTITGKNNDRVKKEITELIEKIDDNDIFKSIEIPILQQMKKKEYSGNMTEKVSNEVALAEMCASMTGTSASVKANESLAITNEDNQNLESEYTDIFLKVFEIKVIIEKLKLILELLGITKLILMLDDVSEIDDSSLKLFIDTVVAPLNNWSDEFIKFKIAFYPTRVHYGMIDPGKIDVVYLDFYQLYSEFDVNKMEENATNFTYRLLLNRFNYFTDGLSTYFDPKLSVEELSSLFFYVSMNVPRIIGYVLAYLYQSVVIYDKKITRQDIENASEKYFSEKIDAFFKASTYCLMSLEEKRDIIQLKKIREKIVDKAKNIKKMIVKGELSGKLYIKTAPYSSHFHVLKNCEKYLQSLELNHFITKYEERINRDGKPVDIYCLNYGLAKQNNILWGKPKGVEYRTYFIERPFNFTNIILEQIKEIKLIKCTNRNCERIFTEADLPGLKFTGFLCPDCHSKVTEEIIIDANVEKDMEEAKELPLLTKDEMSIVLELLCRVKFSTARDISGEVDLSSQRVAKICKKLDEEKGIVIRKMTVSPYEYMISEEGKKYCSLLE